MLICALVLFALNVSALEIPHAPLRRTISSVDRRSLFSAVVTAGIVRSTNVFAIEAPKVVVLGGTGFVGSEVCRQLKAAGARVISTSRDGRDGTVCLSYFRHNLNEE
jgi:S-adenosylhomocysteine hydrolase